jgi:hypothetical protein
MREVQIGDHVLPLEFHTPPTVMRRHQVSCTPDARQLALVKNGNRIGDDDEVLFGLGPSELTDELAEDLGVQLEQSLGSEMQLRKSPVIELVEKKQMLVTGYRNTPLQGVSGLAAVYNASNFPETAGGQFPRNPRVLVWIRRDLFIAQRFRATNCFPIREGERLPFPKSFKFLRDWWS